MKKLAVSGSIVMATECLAGICKTVHDIREQIEEVQQYRIGCKGGVSLACSYRRKADGDSDDTDCAQEDIPVDSDKLPQAGELMAD